MPEPKEDLVSSLSELAVSVPNTPELTERDLPDSCRSRLGDGTVVGLGEASHGTQEFFDLRRRLTQLLVAEFGVRAIGFEAEFDPLCRVDDLVATGEGDVRSLVVDLDLYRPMQTEPMVELFEWLQSFNVGRPPEDRVHVYGFDTTVVENVTNGLRSYLEGVGADVDDSVLADFEVMAAGYGSDDERRAMLESAQRVHSTMEPLFDANESAWVEASSRRAYEHARHRLHLVERQLEAHERDHEGRMALRDEAMAENVEWIHGRSTGPVALWGHNGHLNRGRHVLDGAGWDVDVRSMGEWLAESYGAAYCPLGFELGGGSVAALDGEVGDVVDYPVPDPPSGSVPDVFRRVDDPLFLVSVDDLHGDSSTRQWLRTEPRRHDIWGGHPDGDSPVHYRASDLGEFDWVVFVRETSPLVHLA